MNEPRLFINELRAGQTLDQVFLVRDKDLRTTKTGDLYVSTTLADRTGTLPARMWKATETIFQSIPTDGFLHVKGRVDDYRGQVQLIIDACRPFPAEKVDLGDFLAVSEHDVDKMWSEVLEILADIRNEHLRLLVKKFVTDPGISAGFRRSPAAMQMHHPFVGGLLEHTLNVLRAARALLGFYPQLNADLVLACAFLHDIGKTAELSAGTSIGYTERGQLVGHITIAAVWVQQKAAEIAAETGKPFPPRTLDLVQHVILSHHGEHQWGSPKLPAIPEAFFIHHLDNLDAKVFMTTNAVANDSDPDNPFTAYVRALETRIYKHSDELE